MSDVTQACEDSHSPGHDIFLSEAPLEVVLRFFEESDRQRKADLIP